MAFAAQAGGAARRAGADFGEPVRPQGLRPIPGPPDLPVPPAANDADACPEIACLRGRIPAEVLAAARDRAAAVGVGADRASTTYEEAPARLGPWLRQRTRWFKGWAQTWLVHMRAPHRLWRELGGRGFLAFQLIVGGNVLAALVHPLFLAGLIDAAWRGGWSGGGDGLAALYVASALAGYLVSGLTGFLGLARRRLRKVAWVLLLMPLHWLLLSLAAWRALYQLAVAPYAWEKTEHGLARHSRRAETLTQALVALEGELRRLKESGELPALARERKVRFNVTGSRPSVRPRESGDPERKAADPRFRGNERTVPI